MPLLPPAALLGISGRRSRCLKSHSHARLSRKLGCATGYLSAEDPTLEIVLLLQAAHHACAVQGWRARHSHCLQWPRKRTSSGVSAASWKHEPLEDGWDAANKGVAAELLSAACCDAGTADKAQTSCPALVETLAEQGKGSLYNSNFNLRKMRGSDSDLILLDVRQTQDGSLRLTPAITYAWLVTSH